jgi:hypothetical protein
MPHSCLHRESLSTVSQRRPLQSKEAQANWAVHPNVRYSCDARDAIGWIGQRGGVHRRLAQRMRT